MGVPTPGNIEFSQFCTSQGRTSCAVAAPFPCSAFSQAYVQYSLFVLWLIAGTNPILSMPNTLLRRAHTGQRRTFWTGLLANIDRAIKPASFRFVELVLSDSSRARHLWSLDSSSGRGKCQWLLQSCLSSNRGGGRIALGRAVWNAVSLIVPSLSTIAGSWHSGA